MTRTNRVGRTAAFIGSLFVIASLALGPSAALAKDGDVIRHGRCTASSDWKLKLSPENGRIEVEFEVDQNRNGQTWKVVMKRNGSAFWRGQRTTHAPSGSFEVRRLAADGAGSDRFVVRARNPRSGEVCRGTATFNG